MAVPDYQTLLLPTLRLFGDGEIWKLADLVEELADELTLTVSERQEVTSTCRQKLFYNRIYCAARMVRLANHHKTLKMRMPRSQTALVRSSATNQLPKSGETPKIQEQIDTRWKK